MKEIIFIGLGHRAHVLAGILNKRSDVKIVAGVDVTDGFLQKTFREKFSQFFFTKNIQEALNRFPEAVVFLLTPQDQRVEILKKIGDRPLYLEKPLAANHQDLFEIEKILSARQSVLQIGFVLRTASFYKRIREIILSGELGKVLSFHMEHRLSVLHGARYHINWRREKKRSGGFLNEKSSHDLDLMMFLFQEKPESIFSVAENSPLKSKISTPKYCSECELDCIFRDSYQGFEKQLYPVQFPSTDELKAMTAAEREIYEGCVYHGHLDIFTSQQVFLKFQSGLSGLFSLINLAEKPERSIRIQFENGFLTGNLQEAKIKTQRYLPMVQNEEEMEKFMDHGGSDAVLIDEFFTALDGKTNVSTNFQDAIFSSQIAFAADESVERQEKIKI